MTHAGWANEYKEAARGDERLSKRLVALAKRVATKPEASFPAFLGESELTAGWNLALAICPPSFCDQS